MTRGEWAEGRIHHMHENAGQLQLPLRGVRHFTAWELWDELWLF